MNWHGCRGFIVCCKCRLCVYAQTTPYMYMHTCMHIVIKSRDGDPDPNQENANTYTNTVMLFFIDHTSISSFSFSLAAHTHTVHTQYTVQYTLETKCLSSPSHTDTVAREGVPSLALGLWPLGLCSVHSSTNLLSSPAAAHRYEIEMGSPPKLSK